jgi:hypothetical protein
MTAAAMAIKRVSLRPKLWLTAASRLAARCHRARKGRPTTKAITRIRCTLMPAREPPRRCRRPRTCAARRRCAAGRDRSRPRGPEDDQQQRHTPVRREDRTAAPSTTATPTRLSREPAGGAGRHPSAEPERAIDQGRRPSTPDDQRRQQPPAHGGSHVSLSLATTAVERQVDRATLPEQGKASIPAS